jgi:hypothetical protein
MFSSARFVDVTDGWCIRRRCRFGRYKGTLHLQLVGKRKEGRRRGVGARRKGFGIAGNDFSHTYLGMREVWTSLRLLAHFALIGTVGYDCFG